MRTDVLHLAARQHGVVSRAQLRRREVPPTTVDNWVSAGRLRLLHLGVYLVGGAPSSTAARLMAAVLRSGRGARVTGPTLLRLLGLRGLDEDGIAILVPRERRVDGVPWPVCRTDVSALGHLATIDGIPSFAPGRAVLEAARWWDPAPMVDALRWRGRRDVRALTALVADTPRHAGAVRLRRAGLLRPDAPESGPERRLVALLAHHRPETQVVLLPDLRVDVLLRRAGLVIEYQGRQSHEGPHAQRRDAARFRRIERLGHTVLPVTAEDLVDEAAFVARVDRLVADRAP